MRTLKAKNITPIQTAHKPVPIQAENSEKRLEIAVCIPVYGQVAANWLIQLMRFIMTEMKKHTLHILIHEQQPVSKSREILAHQALDMKPDYIMWLDSDNVIPTGGIDRLIKTIKDTDVDLVTAIYFGKDTPHYPVIRKWRSQGFYHIENPGLGQIFHIDGCGFGCCIMKPEAFEGLEEPWFKFNHEKWGEKDILLSEDLWFCRKLKEKGKKIVCNSGVVSAHIGGAVDAMEYMTFAPIRQSTMEEREECLKDMVKFTGQTEEEVDLKVMVGAERMQKEWEDKNPQGQEEIVKFYKETENYLYDLANWHFSGRRRFDIELVTSLVHHKTKTKKEQLSILDFGCGIGQNSYMLKKAGFNITLADLDSKTLDFAQFRFKEHDEEFRVWKTDIDEAPPLEKYDIIIAYDVFEHLTEEQTKEYVDKMIKVKHEKTQIMMTNSFGTQNGVHPMHFEVSQSRAEQIKRLLEEVPK